MHWGMTIALHSSSLLMLLIHVEQGFHSVVGMVCVQHGLVTVHADGVPTNTYRSENSYSETNFDNTYISSIQAASLFCRTQTCLTKVPATPTEILPQFYLQFSRSHQTFREKKHTLWW